MKQILVACACCNGKGKRELSQPLHDTLKVIHLKFPCTASEIYGRLKNPKLDRSTANKRIIKLKRLGFVKSGKAKRALRVYWPA